MKISEAWLREWVNPAIDTEALVAQLTMAGIEVDSVTPVAGKFDGVVVALVKSVEPHPDADKLRVCKVDGGTGEELQIVCGAANVRPGLKVPLATLGAELLGDLKIKKSKLRGVESFGMLCSEKELGLAETSNGLMELPDDAPVGKNIREYLQLDDQCIEVDLTPNRSDCLSVAGIARELGVLNQCNVKTPDIKSVISSISDEFKVSVAAPQACPRYLGRVIRNINAKAKTPLWMIERLRRAGHRSLGPAVDVTNYVMLELGQPMHAFDLDKLTGSIQVRMARKDEKLTLLDGKEIVLHEKSLVIADTSRTLALAGVMGGADSAVSDDTKNLFLECAFFAPDAIAGRARDFGLHTDSSHRFERGVDPVLQSRAMERATQLLMEICGGQAGPVTEQTSVAHVPSPAPILLRNARIKRLLGIGFDAEKIQDILGRLGMKVEAEGSDWKVTPPGFRFDISIEVDLIEELIRVQGYNTLPRTMPFYQPEMKVVSESVRSKAQLRRVLIERGYLEAITYSFVDPQWHSALYPDARPMVLANPISADLSVMRSGMWAGLLKAVQYNLNRQQTRIRLFETGLVYLNTASGLQQVPRIAGVLCGDVLPEQWSESARKVDFFDLKGDVEALLTASGLNAVFAKTSHPALHPGQSAVISAEGQEIGLLGLLHPQVQKQLDLDVPVYVFELDLPSLLRARVPVFASLSRFPEVRRDLAVLVGRDVPAEALVAAIRQEGSEVLQSAKIFDVYTGKGVDNGLKSVALGLILQGFSRTLTDDEVEAEVQRAVRALKQNFGATLRE
jgi:phenylalanyl-tRNA synthetase beta chain